MDNKEKYGYWEDIAEYDLGTAEAMLLSGRYLYVVFMCQQAVEKLVKGLFVLHKGEEPPRFIIYGTFLIESLILKNLRTMKK